MRAVDMSTYLQWIIDAWDALPTELIVNSFKNCGITGEFDGSDDDKITCFKPTGNIPNEVSELQNARFNREVTELVEGLDLNEDENNGYISENDAVNHE